MSDNDEWPWRWGWGWRGKADKRLTQEKAMHQPSATQTIYRRNPTGMRSSLKALVTRLMKSLMVDVGRSTPPTLLMQSNRPEITFFLKWPGAVNALYVRRETRDKSVIEDIQTTSTMNRVYQIRNRSRQAHQTYWCLTMVWMMICASWKLIRRLLALDFLWSFFISQTIASTRSL